MARVSILVDFQICYNSIRNMNALTTVSHDHIDHGFIGYTYHNSKSIINHATDPNELYNDIYE